MPDLQPVPRDLVDKEKPSYIEIRQWFENLRINLNSASSSSTSSVDHTDITEVTNTGTNTHAQIDTFISEFDQLFTLDTGSLIASVIGELYTKGGRKKLHTSTSATTYVVLSTDEDIKADTDSNAIAINLLAGIEDMSLVIKNTGTSGNDVTINPDGTENLLGANSAFIISDGEDLGISYSAAKGWY